MDDLREDVMNEAEITNIESLIQTHKLIIPIAQRPYVWTEENVDRFINDVFSTKDTNKKFSLGTICLLKDDTDCTVWDGQQRLITTHLLLTAILRYVEEYFEDFDVDKIESVTMSKTKLTRSYFENADVFDEISKTYRRRPTITYMLMNSDLSMQYITSNLFSPSLIKFRDEGDDSTYNFKCRLCGKDTENVSVEDLDIKVTTDKLRAHLAKCQNLESKYRSVKFTGLQVYDKSNMFYNLDYIYCYLELMMKEIIKKYNFNDEEDVIRYLISMLITNNNINCFYTNDTESAGIIFEYENDRGKSCEKFDLVKNKILVNLMDNPSHDLKRFFENQYFATFNKTNKNNLEYLMLSIELHEKSFDPIETVFNKDHSIEYLKVWNAICEEIHRLSKDNIGSYLIESKNLILLKYMYLPIVLLKPNVRKQLIKQIVSFLFLREFANSVRITKDFDTFEQFLNPKMNVLNNVGKFLSKLLNPNLKDNFINTLSTYEFNNFNEIKLVTRILFLYNSWLTNNIDIIVDNLSLEHIIAKYNKRNGEYKLIDTIGNFTLLCLITNKQTRVKGNSSLRIRSYKDKKESYVGSGLLLNKELTKHYDEFDTDDHIKDRSQKIATKLYRILMSNMTLQPVNIDEDEFKGLYEELPTTNLKSVKIKHY